MSGETQNSATESGQITLLGISRTPFEWFALALGPVIYFAFLLSPLGGTVTQRGGLAIIAWSAWWWGSGCIPTGYVVAVPILGTAFLPGMKFGEVLQTLIHPGIGMILGPALIVCMWSRWGFTRRMALFCLSKVGTSVRAQAVTWLLLSTTISFFVANVVIAIAMTPVALEVLKAVGYDTGAKIRKSKEYQDWWNSLSPEEQRKRRDQSIADWEAKNRPYRND